MTALTADQLTAIEFYQENLSYVEGFGLTNLDRPERLLFKKGRRLVEEALAAATRTNKTYVQWTAEEHDAMAACYLQFEGNRPAIVAAFMAFSARHTADAVDIAAQSCKALDTQHPETVGMRDYADGLLNALNALAPGRFKSTR
jgi:hypothetical protein